MPVFEVESHARPSSVLSKYIPLAGELLEIIERRKQRRTVRIGETIMLADLIFHRAGKPIRQFRKSWATACKLAGVPDRLFHDLRRSAVRDLIRSGTPQAVAQTLSGHRTAAVFARYNISTETERREALQRVQEYRQAQRVPVAPKIASVN